MNDLDRVTRALRAEAEEGGFSPPEGAWQEVIARSQMSAVARWKVGRGWLRPAVAVFMSSALVLWLMHEVGPVDDQVDSPGVAAEANALHQLPPVCSPATLDADVKDADQAAVLRLVPTWLPPGDAVTTTYMTAAGGCEELDDIEPVLAAQSERTDGTIDAVAALYGPFSSAPSPPDPGPYQDSRAYTRLRGTAAQIEVTSHDGVENVQITWTEPGGAAWILASANLDEGLARGLAEAIQIHGDPPHLASWPAGELPGGLSTVWTAATVLGPNTASGRQWVVQSKSCEIRLQNSLGTAPLPVPARPGDRPISMGGQRLGWLGADGVLRWVPSPGVLGAAGCGTDADAAAQVAASMILLKPGDTGPIR